MKDKRKLQDKIRSLCDESKYLRELAKDDRLSKDKSMEIQKKQDNVYKKFLFMKNMAKKMR